MTTQGNLKGIRQKKRYMTRKELEESMESTHLTDSDWKSLDSYWDEQYSGENLNKKVVCNSIKECGLSSCYNATPHEKTDKDIKGFCSEVDKVVENI